MTTSDSGTPELTRIRGLTPALYLMSALLIIYPLLQVSAGMDSIDPGELRWRYGAIGLLMDSSLLPLGGLLLAVGTAHLFDHRRLQTVLQALGLLLLASLAASLVMFVLDALQLRVSVRPEVLPLYDRLSLKALAMLLTDIVFVGLLSYLSFHLSRGVRRAERSARRGHSTARIRVADPLETR